MDAQNIRRLTGSVIIRLLQIAVVGIALFIAAFTLLHLLAVKTHPQRLGVPTSADKWLLRNVNIVETVGDSELIPNVDVLIIGGKIAAIDASGHIPLDSTVVDGNGAYVTAGLIDSHVHVEDSAYLALALAKGVTTVRGMRGNPAQLRWRDEIEQGLWLGSRFLVYSPILDGQENLFHTHVANAEQAAERVRDYAAMGYDGIKVYARMPAAALDRVIATARNFDLPVAKHGPYSGNDSLLLSLSGIQSFEHIEDILYGLRVQSAESARTLPDAITEYKAVGVPIVSTLAVFQELTLLSEHKLHYLKQQPLQYMNRAHRQLTHEFGVQRWLDASAEQAKRNAHTLKALLHIAQQLHLQGVPLILGSDSGALIGQAGFATHKEMALLVEAGLPERAVIHSATLAAAKMLGKAHLIGAVKPGLAADFVLTRRNPLQDISVLSTPDAVVKQGIYLNKQRLEALEQNALNTQSPWLTYPLLLWEPLKRLIL